MLCSSTTHVKLANFTAEVCQLEQNGADTSTTKKPITTQYAPRFDRRTEQKVIVRGLGRPKGAETSQSRAAFWPYRPNLPDSNNKLSVSNHRIRHA